MKVEAGWVTTFTNVKFADGSTVPPIQYFINHVKPTRTCAAGDVTIC